MRTTHLALLLLLAVAAAACIVDEPLVDDDDSALDDDDDATGDDDDSATDDDDSAGDDDDSAGPGPLRYVVLATAELTDAAQQWAAWRESGGLTAEVVVLDELGVDPGDEGELLAAVRGHLQAVVDGLPEDEPAFLLILGDAPGPDEAIDGLVPALSCTNSEGDCHSDNGYGDLDGDGIPEVAVGRVPAREPEQALAYLARVQAFEADHPVGLWNRRLGVYAGESGFGEEFDLFAESLVVDSLALINHSFDVVGAWDNPASDYYYVPFGDKVVDLFEEGAVAVMYIGHGSAAFNDGLSVDQLAAMSCDQRPPIAFFFACYNGRFEGPDASIGESVLWSTGGPIAAFAGSDVTHPYANAVLPYEVQRALFDLRPATLGEALLVAKAWSMTHEDETRERMAAFAMLSGMSEDDLDVTERQHLDLYNLLGDPALATRFPASEVQFEPLLGSIEEGDLLVTGRTPGLTSGTAHVTLEIETNETLGELDPDRTDPEVVRANWALANDKVVVAVDAPIEDGAFEASLVFGDELPDVAFYVKVYADDGARDSFGHAVAP
jgi:hypothetical protein